MSIHTWYIIVLCLCIFVKSPSLKTWEQVKGPAGGQALSITHIKNNLFAGSAAGGVFRSDDHGASWYHLDSSYSLNITKLASKGDTLIAGTRYNGLFISPDFGNTWKNIFVKEDPQKRQISALKVFGNTIYISTDMEILRSSDNGKTWFNVTEQSESPRFYFCKDFAKIGNYYFACSSQNYGIIRSNDKGSTWHEANNGLFDKRVYSLIVIDSILYAGTYHNNVFRSTDYGNSWEHCSNGLPPDSSSCYFLYADDTYLFASIGKTGLCVSKDYGKSWNALKCSKLFNPQISGMIRVDKGMYIGTGACAGIYKISLDSMTVLPKNNGFYNRIILSLSSDSNTLLASSYYYTTSLSKKHDNTWIDIFEKRLKAYTCLVKGNDLYIGTSGDGIYYKNKNSSLIFEKQHIEPEPSKYIDIRGFGTIGRYTLACGGNEIVLRKADNESIWKICNNGIASRNYFQDIHVNQGRLFLAGYDFFISDDSGSTWNIKLQRKDGIFNTIATSGTIVYTGQRLNGVYRSLDNGETWDEPLDKLLYVSSLATWNNVVFAGTKGSGIFFSVDSVKTWKHINDGLFNFTITSLTVRNSILYAGSEGNGIFKLDLKDLSSVVHTLPLQSYTKSTNSINILQSGRSVIINSKEPINQIEMYDLLGRNIRTILPKSNIKSNPFSFSIKKTNSQKVIFKVITKNKTITVPVVTVNR